MNWTHKQKLVLARVAGVRIEVVELVLMEHAMKEWILV